MYILIITFEIAIRNVKRVPNVIKGSMRAVKIAFQSNTNPTQYTSIIVIPTILKLTTTKIE
jgi:hypothetical protein